MGTGRRMRVRAVAGMVAAAALLTGVVVGPANAAPESCTYNAGSKSVTATIATGGEATLVVVGGALHFGAVPTACGAATTTNTDLITINGSVGSTERLVLDHRGGIFGPGVENEFNTDEIEIDTALGDFADTLVVYATEGDDVMAPGQNGMALNADGDVDVTFSPGIFHIEAHMLGGNDYFNGRGQGGAGLHFLGPIVLTGGEGNDTLLRGSSDPDVIDGGPGNDEIQGQEGNDVITGGAGNDTIGAGSENDVVTGGSGADSFAGSSGDDTFHADDDEADTLLSGGAGVDTAYFDEGLDPDPVAVENEEGDGGGPPPPPGPCVYSSGTRTVTTTLVSGTLATLSVSSGAIILDGSACGAATTANTDAITVSGTPGSPDELLLNLTGGGFAPGFTAESTGLSEIEISVALGDATDHVEVVGGTGADTLRMGQNGLGLNADSDRDVTFSVLPAVVYLSGLDGADTLSAKGGFGTGSVFLGRVEVFGGNDDDLVQGGGGNDVVDGGSGNDRVEGFNGDDTLLGQDGNDVLLGQSGNDDLTGGTGADELLGAAGNDTLRADDDAADVTISGGTGVDTAYYDLGVDPNPTSTENRIPA